MSEQSASDVGAKEPVASPVLPNARRIVTGHDETGKAILSIANQIDLQGAPFTGNIRVGNIWTTESTPTRDNITEIDGAKRPIPGVGLILPDGINHLMVDLAPGGTIPMHRTSSVDYNILVSGRLILIVDDDVRTEIRPGDVVVQRGTLHGWYNPSTTEWARWVSVLIHAEPVQVNGVDLEEVWNS